MDAFDLVESGRPVALTLSAHASLKSFPPLSVFPSTKGID
jgi:hypothetical protein